MLLKDRNKVYNNEGEQEWYEKAYGKKRNIMKYNMSLQPEVHTTSKFRYFAEIQYTMFPEHHTEFKHLKQDELAKFHVELIEDEYTPNYFESFIELPFGTLTSKLVCKLVGEEDSKY